MHKQYSKLPCPLAGCSGLQNGFALMKTGFDNLDTLKERVPLAGPMQKFFVTIILLVSVCLLSEPAAAQQIRSDGSLAQRMAACTACHGEEGRATRDGFFPRIAGKPAAYLNNQLINFREGRRQSPIMTYMVANMSDEYIAEIAEYFANLHPPYPPARASALAPAVLEHGKSLAISGDASRGIPACIACHGEKLTGISPAVPGLIGLPRDYLVSQLGSWKSGSRKAAAPDCMASISHKLAPEDIAAVSAWLASRPVPQTILPAPASTLELPMPCGGISQQ